jgi:transposase-like protein
VSGENSVLSRAVITPLGKFGSVREAARAHGISSAVISKKCKSKLIANKAFYYEGNVKEVFEDDKRGKHASLAIMTPMGLFSSVREAAQAFGVYHSTISKWFKTKPDQFYKIGESSKKIGGASRKVTTPFGTFDSVGKAAVAENSLPGTVSYRCRSESFPTYYYSE